MRQASVALRNNPHFPERRASTRVRAPLINVDFGDNQTGVVLDLSEGGMAVQISHRLEQGTIVPITFRITDSEPEVHSRGRTAWLSSSGNTVGIEFIELSGENRPQLKRWTQKAAFASTGAGSWSKSPIPAFFETQPIAPGSDMAPLNERSDLFDVNPPRKFRVLWIILIAGGLLIATAFFLVARRKTAVSGDVPHIEQSIPPEEATTVPENAPPVSENADALRASSTPATAPPAAVLPAPVPAPPPTPVRAKSNASARIFLQVAALRNKGNADALVDSLRKKQLPVIINQRSDSGFYVVAVGPFDSIASAQPAKEELSRDGIQTFVLHRVPQH